MASNRPSKMA